MASPATFPLLGSPVSNAGRTHKARKLLIFCLFVAAVVSLTAFISQLQSTTTFLPLHPAGLCATSPNPSSCHAVISEVLSMNSTTESSHTRSAVHVLQNIIARSVQGVDAAVRLANELRSVMTELRRKAAVADCAHLMDLSRDRLLTSSSAITASAYDDARTWLSAILTNHDTCLDGIRDGSSTPTKPEMEARVEELAGMASAALAVLNRVAALQPSSGGGDDISRPILGFPSWVSLKDQRVLEAAVGGVQADVVVAKDGSGRFQTVQAAIDAAPSNSGSRYVIYVKKGTYKENVNVGKQKKNIMIVGDGMDATVITGSLNVVDGATTFNSATLAVDGDGFMLQDLRVQNTAGPEKHQAVALRVSADKSIINRCRLEGYQDTLYNHALRQFFRDSTVSGTVDFIFGNAAVVLQNCNLVARRPMANQQNLVTAQGRTDPNQNTGTSIQSCQVIPAPDLVPVKGSIPTYLGRPWKEYSRTVVMQSYIDNHVAPKGWTEWSGDFALKTLYYGEYMNKGSGAGTAGRVKWPGYHVFTKASEAMPFTVGELIQGGTWLKGTGVAYTEGL